MPPEHSSGAAAKGRCWLAGGTALPDHADRVGLLTRSSALARCRQVTGASGLTSGQGVTAAQMAVVITTARLAATSQLLGIPEEPWRTPAPSTEEEEQATISICLSHFLLQPRGAVAPHQRVARWVFGNACLGTEERWLE